MMTKTKGLYTAETVAGGMVKKAVVGKTQAAGEPGAGSLDGIDSGSAGFESPAAPAGKGGFHVPKPILYFGLSVAALALAAGVAVAVSQPWRNKDYGGGAVVTQTVTPSYATPTVAATPVPWIESVMSREQLKATLEEILAFSRQNGVEVGQAATNDEWQKVTPEDRAIWKKTEQANKTIYFMLTGRTFEQDKFVTRIVRPDEQVSNVHPDYRNPDGTLNVAGTLARLPDGTTEIYAQGVPTMYANSSKNLLLLVANETGQALDIKLSTTGKGLDGAVLPRNNGEVWKTLPQKERLNEDEGGLYIEATKHIYQSAVLHFIEELGVKGIAVADTPENRKQIQKGVEIKASIDHYITNAWVFAWWYALNDQQAKQELETSGKINSATALKLHNKLLAEIWNPQFKQMIQNATSLEIKARLQPQIAETLYKRLRSDGMIRDVLPGEATYLFVP